MNRTEFADLKIRAQVDELAEVAKRIESLMAQSARPGLARDAALVVRVAAGMIEEGFPNG